jgi:hypothetical protein
MSGNISPLSDDLRDAWIRTVLVIVHSEPQRRAFIAGYNGDPRPTPSSDQMRRNYALGKQVHATLAKDPTP